ncbi:GNAT family N-acetyltransferase [Frankia nepalensis]|uniref:GNAT family N-acetyltransferase n=1 Tax=Frankia nepalensis TaxID=1836974 RepID=A0A937RFR6_9ACTN|nr:GNAT family protein [Frankia nepalensis]MBL7498867.1 GNAT family N-acetyltransferase [Frankia nepalensis]MBL7513699.1 GNAT family N-acetyltransferase [Frankia nepalensis]MBL7631353.1 GNAT family N-acetyltransferase [Frankia nepalensis]
MPELRTARLVLRPVTAADRSWLRDLWDSPAVRRYLFDDVAVTADQVAELVEASVTTMAASARGLWALRRATPGPETRAGEPVGEPVGVCGLMDRAAGDGVELVCSLTPARWGQGLAQEASRAVLAHAFATLGLAEVHAEVDEANGASLALVRRLGATRTDTRQGDHGPLHVYRLRPAGQDTS